MPGHLEAHQRGLGPAITPLLFSAAPSRREKVQATGVLLLQLARAACLHPSPQSQRGTLQSGRQKRLDEGGDGGVNDGEPVGVPFGRARLTLS